MPNSLGRRLASLRKEKGFTQKQVAEMLNISNKTLSSWEVGNTMPDLEVLPKLADIYGVSCDKLLRGDYNSDNNISAISACDTANEPAQFCNDNNVDDNIYYDKYVKLKKKTILAYYCVLSMLLIAFEVSYFIFLVAPMGNTPYIFSPLLILILIPAIVANKKMFKIQNNEYLTRYHFLMRYRFIMASVCLTLCLWAIGDYLIDSNVLWIGLILLSVIITVFMFVHILYSIKKPNMFGQQQKLKAKKLLKFYFSFIFIGVFVMSLTLTFNFVIIKKFDINMSTITQFNTYQEAVDSIQNSDLFDKYKYSIPDYSSCKDGDKITVTFSPKQNSSINLEDFIDYKFVYKENSVNIEFVCHTIRIKGNYYRYFIANPEYLDNTRIISNDQGYSIIHDSPPDKLNSILVGVSYAYIFYLIVSSFCFLVSFCSFIEWLILCCKYTTPFINQKNTN